MKLQQFVTEALLEITNGIVEAQKKTQLIIAPGTFAGKKITTPQSVKFELIVTVSKDGGGSIDVLGMGEIGGKLASETTQTISFEIPVYFNSPTPFNTIADHKALSTPSSMKG